MSILATLGRPMLAGMFISGGASQVLDAESKAPVARDVVDAIDSAVDNAGTINPIPARTSDAVRLNGAVQIAAGTMLALGKFPRLSSLALAASLVPTTLAAHRFWDESDPDARSSQEVQFLKNVAMLGGLLIAADHTGGRPSIGWRARRAAIRAGTVANSVAGTAADATSTAADKVVGLRS